MLCDAVLCCVMLYSFVLFYEIHRPTFSLYRDENERNSSTLPLRVSCSILARSSVAKRHFYPCAMFTNNTNNVSQSATRSKVKRPNQSIDRIGFHSSPSCDLDEETRTTIDRGVSKVRWKCYCQVSFQSLKQNVHRATAN